MIFSVLDGKSLTFNGCTAIVGKANDNLCVATCDNSGRDIELVNIADLIPYVRAETAYKDGDTVAYADAGAIEQHIAWTLTDFTKQTGILSRRAVIDIQAGVRDYYITPPQGETVYRVSSVCVNGHCLTGYRGSECCTTGKCRSSRGGFVFEPLDKIVLDEATCKDCGKIEVQYTTHASNTACTIDKLVIERFQEAIVMGAGARLRKMAGFGWSLPAKGLDMHRDYKMAIDQYKLDDAEGHMNGNHQMNTYGSEASH
ncbi:MAG: hypothetical protein ACRC6G_12100, partial [Deefgea sp.]